MCEKKRRKEISYHKINKETRKRIRKSEEIEEKRMKKWVVWMLLLAVM